MTRLDPGLQPVQEGVGKAQRLTTINNNTQPKKQTNKQNKQTNKQTKQTNKQTNKQ